MEDFEHSYTRRKRGHDYRAPAIYHIILKKAKGAPAFGSLTGDARIAPGQPGCVAVNRSELGKIIQKEVYDLRYSHSAIQIYQYVVMPDHVHILLRVKEMLPKAIGSYIGGMKTTVKKRWNAQRGAEPGVSGTVAEEEVFEKNYTDKIIHPGRSLESIFRYIRENPHRLAIRQLYPEFFRNEKLHEEWLEEAATGGVLVSPFISPLEKNAYRDAVAAGGRIIYVQKEAFGERYRPAEEKFQLCCEGRLLILAPAETLGDTLTAGICRTMNAVAEAIAKGDFEIGAAQ